MKTYKYLFWITLILFIIFTGYSYVKKIEYEIDSSLKDWQITDYRRDINIIDKIVFETDHTKYQIDSILKDFNSYDEDVDFFKIKKNTVFLENTYLIFKNDSLISIENNW